MSTGFYMETIPQESTSWSKSTLRRCVCPWPRDKKMTRRDKIHPSIHPSIHLSIYPSIHPFYSIHIIYLSIYLSVCLCVCVSVCLSACLSFCLSSIHPAIHLSIYNYIFDIFNFNIIHCLNEFSSTPFLVHICLDQLNNLHFWEVAQKVLYKNIASLYYWLSRESCSWSFQFIVLLSFCFISCRNSLSSTGDFCDTHPCLHWIVCCSDSEFCSVFVTNNCECNRHFRKHNYDIGNWKF